MVVGAVGAGTRKPAEAGAGSDAHRGGAPSKRKVYAGRLRLQASLLPRVGEGKSRVTPAGASRRCSGGGRVGPF
ncbi:MAG: hypothetical protein WAK66_16280, partial [Methylocystis sp.]